MSSTITGRGKILLIAIGVWVVLSGLVSGGTITAVARILLEAARP